MKLSYIGFVAATVVRSLKELLWSHLLTSGTMAMALFIFGGFLLLQENLRGIMNGWGDQIQIVLYLREAPAASELQALVARVRAFPEVASIRYVSQEKAWDDFKRSLGSQSGLLEGLDSDILPPSLEIALKPQYRGRDTVKELAARLKSLNGIGEVQYPEEWFERLNILLWAVQSAQWIFGGFLFLATLFIIGNTVKLAILARQDEIEIMQLVGATGGLIKAPFILEGMIQGFFGALLSLVLLGGVFFLVGAQLPATFGMLLPRGEFTFLDWHSAGLLLVLGWALGGCGSSFAVRRFLNT